MVGARVSSVEAKRGQSIDLRIDCANASLERVEKIMWRHFAAAQMIHQGDGGKAD
jgi:hypothetical protein